MGLAKPGWMGSTGVKLTVSYFFLAKTNAIKFMTLQDRDCFVAVKHWLDSLQESYV